MEHWSYGECARPRAISMTMGRRAGPAAHRGVLSRVTWGKSRRKCVPAEASWLYTASARSASLPSAKLYIPVPVFLLLPLLCSPSNGCCSPDARWNVQEGLALYLIYHWRSKCCWFDCWPLFLSQIGNPLLSLYCPCLLFLKVLNYDILTFWVLLVCMILHSSSVHVIILPCYSVEPWERWTSLLLEKYMSHQQWLQKSTGEMQLAGHLPW